MTAVRPYADLAPQRHQPTLQRIIRLLAIIMLTGLAAHYLLGLPNTWWEAAEGLFFAGLGLDWFLWSNGPISNPFTTRFLGALMFVCGVWIFLENASHLI